MAHYYSSAIVIPIFLAVIFILYGIICLVLPFFSIVSPLCCLVLCTLFFKPETPFG